MFDFSWRCVSDQLLQSHVPGTQTAFGAKMTSSRRFDVNTTSFLRHVPAGKDH